MQASWAHAWHIMHCIHISPGLDSQNNPEQQIQGVRSFSLLFIDTVLFEPFLVVNFFYS